MLEKERKFVIFRFALRRWNKVLPLGRGRTALEYLQNYTRFTVKHWPKLGSIQSELPLLLLWANIGP